MTRQQSGILQWLEDPTSELICWMAFMCGCSAHTNLMELSGGWWSCQAELLLQLGAELAHRMCEAWSMFSRQFVKGFNFSGGDQGNLKFNWSGVWSGYLMVYVTYKYAKHTSVYIFTCMKVYMHSHSGSLWSVCSLFFLVFPCVFAELSYTLSLEAESLGPT